MAQPPVLIPAWTQGILLQNRGVPQTVMGEIDMYPRQLFAQQLKIKSRVELISRIKFQREGVSGIAEIGNNPAGLIIRTLTTNPEGPNRHGLINIFSNTVMNNLSTQRVTTPTIKVPNSIRIKPEGNTPKTNPLLVEQGSTTELNISKVSFAYFYSADTPNFVQFDLSFFPSPLDFTYFVKNSTGTNNIPGVVLTLNTDTSVLTVTGIPDVAGVCSAMLFFF